MASVRALVIVAAGVLAVSCKFELTAPSPTVSNTNTNTVSVNVSPPPTPPTRPTPPTPRPPPTPGIPGGNASPGGPRPPDPGTGVLPLPLTAQATVAQIAAVSPTLIAQSCQAVYGV